MLLEVVVSSTYPLGYHDLYLLQVFLELLVCTIHPPPGDVEFFSKPAVESLLSILMFMRLYLLARFFVVHSHFVTNTATQSLGALNKVRYIPFVLVLLIATDVVCVILCNLSLGLILPYVADWVQSFD